MAYTNFKELKVWQKAMDAIVEVYKIIKLLPSDERYALGDQMRRAAVSIASNIAEGQGRYSSKDFCHFLAIANGSTAELETQLLVAERVGYLHSNDIKTTIEMLHEIHAMLLVLQKKLREQQ